MLLSICSQYPCSQFSPISPPQSSALLRATGSTRTKTEGFNQSPDGQLLSWGVKTPISVPVKSAKIPLFGTRGLFYYAVYGGA